MNKKVVICPACGSDSIETIETEKTIKEPYGEPLRISINEYTCKVCGIQGDFLDNNDQIISTAIESAKKNSIYNIIEDLSQKKISMSAIERALDLPQRTLSKWKNGLSSPSASGVTLMYAVRTYPWLLDVAQHKFDPIVSRDVHIKAAVSDLLKMIPVIQEDIFTESGMIATSNSLFMYIKIDKKDQNTQIESSKRENYSLKDVSFTEVTE